MFYDEGCHGRVVVGDLPDEIRHRLVAIPGEWLEFDPSAGVIVVRHVQPTSGPSLPTIARELVWMLAEIPAELHERIGGGELLVHTEDSPHLVRLRVEPGGSVRIDWAHPSYAEARKKPYTDGREVPTESVFCRLNGQVTFAAQNPEVAARDMQRLADTFEGLYPEGDFRAGPVEGGVRVVMRDVNLDARLLVARLQGLAQPGSVAGSVEVSSFDDRHPDERVRIVFHEGKTWVQEPFLWAAPANNA
jgi:hypothetical protein